MNRKQSHQPLGSYGYSQNHKIQYHVASPYIQLLQSKKKGQGYRYDTKNIRSFTNYTKPSPVSISSIFVQGSKPFKSTSTQKVKINRSAINDRKKRSRTEQAQQKMHQSMCVYQSIHNKSNEQSASKSLYYNALPKQSYEIQPNPYLPQPHQKNKRKRHLSDNKHNHSHQNNLGHNNILGSLDNLNINDIDGLLNLIDNCVNQANQYIGYLLEKLELVKEELLLSKAHISQFQKQIYSKDMQLVQKDQIISSLQKQLKNKNTSELLKEGRRENGFEVKNLLQIIEKISQENQKLRGELEMSKNIGGSKISNEKEREGDKEKDARRDFYNQIHSKIDILNISIDNNHGFNRNEDNSDGKEKRDKQIAKKYKFIKPRNR